MRTLVRTVKKIWWSHKKQDFFNHLSGCQYEECWLVWYKASSLVDLQQLTEAPADSFHRVYPEDRGSRFVRNTTTYLSHYTTSHPHVHRLRTLNSTTVSIVGWVTFFRVSIGFSSKKAEDTKLDSSRGMLFDCRTCVLYTYDVHPVKQVPTNEWSSDPSNVSSRCRASSETPPTEKKKGMYKVVQRLHLRKLYAG